jgi:hypothetical protein
MVPKPAPGPARRSLHGDPPVTDVDEAYALVASGTATGKVVLEGWGSG